MLFEPYSKRLARLKTSGQFDVYQYDTLPPPFRRQVIYIWERAIGTANSQLAIRQVNELWNNIHSTLAEAYGLAELGPGSSPFNRCQTYILNAETPGALDLIDLSFGMIYESDTASYTLGREVCQQALEDLNFRFQEHGIGFEFISGEIIRKDSQFLHEEAVKPALHLLSEPGFEGPQAEFLTAHEHYRHGRTEDAIVSAHKAFESTIKTICDRAGWEYEPNAPAQKLIQTVFDHGLIPPALQQQFTSFKQLLESGLPTVRNRMGAHGAGSAPVTVPAFMTAYALHLAASNIVLLAEAYQSL